MWIRTVSKTEYSGLNFNFPRMLNMLEACAALYRNLGEKMTFRSVLFPEGRQIIIRPPVRVIWVPAKIKTHSSET